MIIDKNKHTQLGSKLEDGHHHDHSHDQWSRRNFLSSLGIGGGMGMMLGQIPIMTFAQSKLQEMLTQDESERVLLIIRLKGGNDGLNTIIPLPDYDYYRNVRPTVGFQESQIIKLNDEIAVPTTLRDLEGLWAEGAMKVLRNVGYEDQNLSHFTSSDIWAKSSESISEVSTGWLGRYFEGQFPDFALNPPAIPPAILIGYSSNLIFSGTASDMGFTVSNPEELYEIAQTGFLYDVANVPDGYYGEQLAYARTVANNTAIYSESIHSAYIDASNSLDFYEDWGDDSTRYFADQMAIVSRLIKGRLGTKVYMVELEGFDTHEGQPDRHDALMRALSKGVDRLYKDLKDSNQENDVLTMTISEFGRRVEENGSLGTDHGAGAPLFFFGPTLSNSEDQLIGQAPNLQETDYVGNIISDIDFRSVYASVLENWFCINPEEVNTILLGDYPRIDNIGLTCNSNTVTSIQQNKSSLNVQHFVQYGGTGSATIHYSLPIEAKVRIEIFDISGKVLTSQNLAFHNQGEHQYSVPITRNTLQMAFYKITVNNDSFSGKIRLY